MIYIAFILQEISMHGSGWWGVVGAIIGIAGTYISTVALEKQRGKNELDLKHAETADDHLQKSLSEAITKIEYLEAALAEEKRLRLETELRLRDVKVAFETMYFSLDRVLGSSEEGAAMMNKLKHFIEKKTE